MSAPVVTPAECSVIVTVRGADLTVGNVMVRKACMSVRLRKPLPTHWGVSYRSQWSEPPCCERSYGGRWGSSMSHLRLRR